MANRTNLSSWGNLRDYLKTNVDPDKDWDNEDIKDYSALLGAQAAGKVSGDKFTEGRNLFQHYLADAQATDVYQQAQAKAENEARRETAYGNYLSTRLGSYLREIQGNAGIAGYGGLTHGQAIAVKNDQENAFRTIQDNKRTALKGYFDKYQETLASNSETAIGKATSIDAAREEKNANEEANVRSRLNEYLLGTYDELMGGYTGGALKEDGTVSATDDKKLRDYINAAAITDESKARILADYELNYGDNITGALDENGNEVLSQKQKEEITSSVKNAIETNPVNSGNYENTMSLLEQNKDALGEEYHELVDNVNKQMDEYTHTKGKGYEVDFSTIKTNQGPSSEQHEFFYDISVKVNGQSFSVRFVKGVNTDTGKSLNALATGSSDKMPARGTIVEKDGKLYALYSTTYKYVGWREIGDGKNKASDLLAAWNKYDKASSSITDSVAAENGQKINDYFAAAYSNGADVRTAYTAGGASRDILRNVKISAFGNKTFGEVMDEIDNSTVMTGTEKGRRRTSAYNQLAEEVKKQGIQY